MRSLFATLIFPILFLVAACNNGAAGDANGHGAISEKIKVEDFDKKLNAISDAQLVDVRTAEEYTGGHLKNAVNIDYRSDEFEKKIGALDKNKPVFVYCLSGGRSSSAASKMESMGFKEVYNMDGGIMKWTAAGKPIDMGAAAPQAAGMSLEEFAKITASGPYVLIDFNANWCEPCKKMMPIIEKIVAEKKDRLKMVSVDADKNKDLLNKKGISGIPYLELYQNGKLVWKHEGGLDEAELRKEINM